MKKLILILAGAIILGGLVGYGAGAFFARENPTVQLAALVALEDSQNLKDQTLETTAFRASGASVAQLNSDAAAILRQFRVAGLLFGAFIGLVLSAKLCARSDRARSKEYEIDRDECVSCGRCFLSCPRERLRLKKLELQK